MVKKSLYCAWVFLYLLCAGMGFVPVKTPLAFGAMVALGVLFFVPPMLIVCMAVRQKCARDLRRVRNLSLLWLGVTLVLLPANFLSALAPQWVGDWLYALLVILSSPMVCSQIWFVSLALWALLLWTSMIFLGKSGKAG